MTIILHNETIEREQNEEVLTRKEVVPFQLDKCYMSPPMKILRVLKGISIEGSPYTDELRKIAQGNPPPASFFAGEEEDLF